MKLRALWLPVLLGGLSACSTWSSSETPGVQVPTASTPVRLVTTTPRSPEETRSFDISYRSLPLMGKAGGSRKALGVHARITNIGDGDSGTPALVAFDVAGVGSFQSRGRILELSSEDQTQLRSFCPKLDAPNGSNWEVSLRPTEEAPRKPGATRFVRSRSTTPAPDDVSGVELLGPLNPSLGVTDPQHGRSQVPGSNRPAQWEIIRRHDGPEIGLDVTRFEGIVTPECSAEALRAGSVVAHPIVPHVIYAYRQCVRGCDLPEGAPGREERLEIIGPSALWVGSSGPTSKQRLPRRQAFTALELKMAKGESGSLSLATSKAERARFDDTGVDSDWGTLMSYTIEVVWPESDPAPMVTAYLSKVEGDEQHFAPERESRYSPPTSYEFDESFVFGELSGKKAVSTK